MPPNPGPPVDHPKLWVRRGAERASASKPPAPGRSHVRLVALTLIMALLTTGCFSMRQGETFAVGTERNRANVVIFTKPSKFLAAYGQKHGSRSARKLILSQTPNKVRITAKQRAAICVISVALCLSADLIGRRIISWFKSDIRNRADFWPPLHHAGKANRCFTWTFAPSRNLTHKGIGTSGCERGR